jgi:hypothetical protein
VHLNQTEPVRFHWPALPAHEQRAHLLFEDLIEGKNGGMVLLLVLLLVLIFAGAGFALHVLWILAVIFALFWLIGAALGRGESAGRHRFYRW